MTLLTAAIFSTRLTSELQSEWVLSTLTRRTPSNTTGHIEVHRRSRYLHFHKAQSCDNEAEEGSRHAAVQVYSSALVFAPTSSITRHPFSQSIPRWMRRLPKVENNWNAVQATLEDHKGLISAVVFSPDGKTLASASYDKTVKLHLPRAAAVQTTVT